MSLRTGGREAVEDTPVTGAPQEVIQTAIEESDAQTPYLDSESYDIAGNVIDALTESGYVIVRAEDALTTEDRAAIRDGIAVIDGFDRSLEKLQDADDMFDVSTTQVDFREYRNCLTADGLARLRAIADGGQA